MLIPTLNSQGVISMFNVTGPVYVKDSVPATAPWAAQLLVGSSVDTLEPVGDPVPFAGEGIFHGGEISIPGFPAGSQPHIAIALVCPASEEFYAISDAVRSQPLKDPDSSERAPQINTASFTYLGISECNPMEPDNPQEQTKVTIAFTRDVAVLEWDSGILESSELPSGPYKPLADAVSSPYIFKPTDHQQFFKVTLPGQDIPVPLDGFVIPELDLEMVAIPLGTFTMGSPSDEIGRIWNEGPQTEVTFRNPFWIGKHEVTIDQFRSFLLSGGSRRGVSFSHPFCPIKNKPNYELRGNEFGTIGTQPMIEISWNAAKNFCEWLTDREHQSGRLQDGYEYNLPTEAQWEYACRAGTTTPFSYGVDPDYSDLENYAWYRANSEARTHPVGELLPNAWGLHDMHGNVSEWCLNWATLEHPGGSVVDPTGPSTSDSRIHRGGSWSVIPFICRSAIRHVGRPDHSGHNRGFRLALVPIE